LIKAGTYRRRRAITTSMASPRSRRSGARSAYNTPMKTATSVSPTGTNNKISLINPVPKTGFSSQ
jgi:hypothetical protein